MKTCFHSHFYANFYASVILLFFVLIFVKFSPKFETKNLEMIESILEDFAHILIGKGLMIGPKSSLGKSLHVGMIYVYIAVTDLIMIREYYAHREDKLYNKIHNHKTSWVTEYFHPGRARCLKGIYHMMLLLFSG